MFVIGPSILTPLKFNMVHLKISPLEKEIPTLEIIIFRFYVKLQGCIFEFLEKRGGHDAYYKVVQ